MLVFATSDKGGTGRSVTSCNIVYRRALQGGDVCYLDFDFGSPTAGAIFEVTPVVTGTPRGGLHSYLRGQVTEPVRLDVWTQSDRIGLRSRPVGSGQLVLFPGDQGGGEFSMDDGMVERCAQLFLQLEEEFDVSLIDLSAGRSFAIDMALRVTGREEMRSTTARWMVFHRWTRQHIVAAAGFVFGERGILKTGVGCGHDESLLRDSIRFVRTAVMEPTSPVLPQMRPPQAAWLRNFHRELQDLASDNGLGRTTMLGQTPVDPVLQWREQLITDEDVTATRIANPDTADSFDDLARRLSEDAAWEGL